MPAIGAAGTPGWFTLGTPGGAVATQVTADFLNDLIQNLEHLRTEAGTTWTKGDATDIFDSIIALILNRGPKGILDGKFEYVSASQVRFARALEGRIRIQIDDVVFSPTSDLTFDLTADLDTGSEAGTTWYYCYASDESGTLTPHISATGPEVNPANKVGYHPDVGGGKGGWRFVGAFWNNGSSNIEPFDKVGQDYYFRQLPLSISPGVAITNTILAIDLDDETPVDAEMVHLVPWVRGDDHNVVYTHASHIGSSWEFDTNTQRMAGGVSLVGATETALRALANLAVPLGANGGTDRAVGWASDNDAVGAGSPANLAEHTLYVRGWRSRF